MKKVYKLVLSLIATVIVVAGAWAMHSKKNSYQNNKQAEYYYHFKGNTGDLAAYQTLTNWELLTDEDAPGCTTGTIPCVVKSTQSDVQSFVSSIVNESDVEGHEYSQKDPIPEQ